MMQRTQAHTGVSFVEILTVVAIITILGTVAVPSYRTYVIKSKIGALLPLFDEMKKDVIEKRLKGGSFGNTETYYIDRLDTNKPEGLYAAFIGYNGCIYLEWNNTTMNLPETGNYRLVQCPYEDKGNIQWVCGHNLPGPWHTDAWVKYTPPDCQKGINPTTYQSAPW